MTQHIAQQRYGAGMVPLVYPPAINGRDGIGIGYCRQGSVRGYRVGIWHPVDMVEGDPCNFMKRRSLAQPAKRLANIRRARVAGTGHRPAA
jgi:hypothetical protein